MKKVERINKKCLICDKEIPVRLLAHQKGKGKFCSHVCAGKYRSEHYKKNKNPNWKGGNWTDVSKEVKQRDDYTCQLCGFREPKIMEVDHIKSSWTHPKLFLERKNLRTLCPNCHARKTIEDKQIINLIKKSMKKNLQEAKESIASVKIWEQS